MSIGNDDPISRTVTKVAILVWVAGLAYIFLTTNPADTILGRIVVTALLGSAWLIVVMLGAGVLFLVMLALAAATSKR